MKEFMMYVRNEKDAKLNLNAEEHLAFIKQCEVYIGGLKKNNNLIAAQPIQREGVSIRKSGNNWEIKDIDINTTVQVGYYHIMAKDMEDAIRIAKENPEFAYVPSASIELRPIKTKEADTGFVYPVNNK
jgi:hypothetical protein